MTKVAQLAMRKAMTDRVILTGGLSHSAYFTRRLSEQIGKNVESTADGRYAGALGAAILAEEKSRRGRQRSIGFYGKASTLLKGREEIRVAENSALLTKKIPKFRRYLFCI